MPQNETTMNRCQPIQRGLTRKCHTGPDLTAGDGGEAAAALAGPAFSMPPG
jgi:hypothetical protein